MSFWEGLAHVLRHGWLWPIEFWLRPLDVIDRGWHNGYIEVFAAFLGGVVWGAVTGSTLWLASGEFQAIWMLSLLLAMTSAAAAGIIVYGFAGIQKLLFAVLIASILSDAYTIAISIISGLVGLTVGDCIRFGAAALLSAFARIISSALFLIGTLSFDKDIASIIDTKNGLAILITIITPFIIAGTRGVAIVLIGIIGSVLSWLSYLATFDKLVSSFAFILPVVFGVLTGFFVDSDIKDWRHKSDLRKAIKIQSGWLLFNWSLFLVLAISAKLFNETTSALPKSNILWMILFWTPFASTGLLFWPIVYIIALYQSRRKRLLATTSRYFFMSLPFQWQSFAYPLPSLYKSLVSLYQNHGAESAFLAIQSVQFGSLQMEAARCAALHLATEADTALPFCGYVAISTNASTMAQFALAGFAARSITVIARKKENEDRQTLLLYVGETPTKSWRPMGWLTEFMDIREQELPTRINYALRQLKHKQKAVQAEEYTKLLENWLAWLDNEIILNTPNISLFENTLENVFMQHQKWLNVLDPGSAIPKNTAKTDTAWLQQGWEIFYYITNALSQLRNYHNLTTSAARREFIERLINSVNTLNFDGFSEYWRNVGLEFCEIWIDRLTEELRRVRELLRLEIQLN